MFRNIKCYQVVIDDTKFVIVTNYELRKYAYVDPKYQNYGMSVTVTSDAMDNMSLLDRAFNNCLKCRDRDMVWAADNNVVPKQITLNELIKSFDGLREFTTLMRGVHIQDSTAPRRESKNDVYRQRWNRVRGIPPRISAHISVMDFALTESQYIHYTRLCRELAEEVRLAIATNNVYEIERVCFAVKNMVNINTFYLQPQRLFKKVTAAINKKHNLEEGTPQFELLDCGHWAPVGMGSPVGRRADRHVCSTCLENRYQWAVDVDCYLPQGEVYEHDDGDYYSYREGDESEIQSYSTDVLDYTNFKHGITSSAFGDFTLGVELEMTCGSVDFGAAISQVRRGLGKDYVIVKQDGSLPSGGFEVVTAPARLDQHIDKFKNWAINPKFRAWDNNRCGVHVHIDSRAFTKLTLGKFLMLINDKKNTDFIKAIAGRHPSTDSNAANYCASDSQTFMVNPAKAILGKKCDTQRYRMVNLQNLGCREAERLGLEDSYDGPFNTVELRIFRASLRKERLLAQIEFAHAAVMFVRSASYRDLNQEAFVHWLSTTQNLYPNLAKWFDVKETKTNPRVSNVVSETDGGAKEGTNSPKLQALETAPTQTPIVTTATMTSTTSTMTSTRTDALAYITDYRIYNTLTQCTRYFIADDNLSGRIGIDLFNRTASDYSAPNQDPNVAHMTAQQTLAVREEQRRLARGQTAPPSIVQSLLARGIID